MKFWSYIASFLSGIISGLLLFFKLDGPDTTINENTSIGKMKQRGQGNVTKLTIDQDAQLTAKELRQKQREERKLLRQDNRRERKSIKEAKEEGP
jgi:hypothetical protein